jgi:signal transduction histidine kinase
MTFARFIEENIGSVVDEFEAFARTISDQTAKLSSEELQDHSKLVLKAVARDMASFQSAAAQQEKSQGEARGSAFSQVRDTARQHAEHRFQQGFTLPQMVSEYRALRASVIRLWLLEVTSASGEQLEEFTRFGEAIDEGLTEAIGWYSKRLEDSRSLLIGVMAHDLRAPLAAVRMSAEYLLRSEDLHDGELRAATRIVTSTTRMAGYVKDLLDFTRTLLGAGLPVHREPLDLALLCEEVIDELHAAHPNATVQLTVEATAEGSWDGARMSQLLTNLVVNAVAHGDPSHPVAVTLSDSEAMAVISVHNQGPAIPAGDLPTLFQPLMLRGSVPRRSKGSSGLGLGLYISQQIAIAHGGTLQVTSDDQNGTTFVARLAIQ